MNRYPVLAAVLVFVFATAASAQQLETEIVLSAVDVLDDMVGSPTSGIPKKLLKEAHAVAVFPHVLKAGFVIGGRHGRGVLCIRKDDGSWSNPVFLSITGGSVGFQVGAQSTDIILVFRTKNGVNSILNGRSKIKLGGDISIAAGPAGVEAGAATDAQLRSEIYSYSRSRGLFAGASLEGAGIKVDWIANESYYDSENMLPRDIVSKPGVPVRESAVQLIKTLHDIAGPELPPPSASKEGDAVK